MRNHCALAIGRLTFRLWTSESAVQASQYFVLRKKKLLCRNCYQKANLVFYQKPLRLCRVYSVESKPAKLEQQTLNQQQTACVREFNFQLFNIFVRTRKRTHVLQLHCINSNNAVAWKRTWYKLYHKHTKLPSNRRFSQENPAAACLPTQTDLAKVRLLFGILINLLESC